MKLLTLVASQVQIGVALPWSIRNDRGMVLLARGYVIQDEEQVRNLLERGAYVDAEDPHTHGLHAVPESAKPITLPPRPKGLFHEWAAICQRLEDPLKNIGTTPDFVECIDTLARDVIALTERDEDVSIYTIVRQEGVAFFNYGFTHSVHSAIACVLMAGRLGWPAEQSFSLVKAALTMNVSIAELMGRIATQGGALIDQQKKFIREHTTQSLLMLREAGVSDPDWLTAVAQHHELPDGSGYPDGIADISPLAALLRHADTVTAKISPRASRPGMTTQQAATELFKADNGGAMSTAFIRAFGIYPPGDFVRLKSGEVGVVMRRSANVRAPLAASVTDKAGVPAAHTIRRDTADPAFAIIGGVTDQKMLTLLARIPVQRLYGMSI